MLLLYGGVGRPADFGLMAAGLIADGCLPFTVDLGLGIDTIDNAKRIRLQ